MTILTISRRCVLPFVIAVLCYPPFASGQVTFSSARLNAIMNAYHQLGLFNGNVLIANNENIIFQQSYGAADLSSNRKNSAVTRFNIYSITKPFTSTVILQLAGENLLSLDEPISRFFPTLSAADSITVRHLLTHSSGLFAYNNDFSMPVTSEAAMLSWLGEKPLDFRPGSQFRYNNTGYYLLGYIIEKLTGQSYEAAVRSRIFVPAGMNQSGFDLRTAAKQTKATGYSYIGVKTQEKAAVWDYRELFSAGGIYSTATDLLLFQRALQNKKLLPDSSLKEAYTPFQKNYGYGWFIDSIGGQLIVSHSGGATGFRTYLVQNLTTNTCIILLGNSETSDIVTLRNKLLDELNGRPYQLPATIPGLSQRLSQYEGVYPLTPSLVLYVHQEKGQLMATPSRQGSSILLPVGNDEFRIESKAADFLFKGYRNGSFDSLVFSQKGQTVTAARMDASWGITGNATPNGWNGPDIVMQREGRLWIAKKVKLNTGIIKFRYNNDWVLNYGLNPSTRRLQKGGGDIEVTAGTYTILLDLKNKDRPTWKLVR